MQSCELHDHATGDAARRHARPGDSDRATLPQVRHHRHPGDHLGLRSQVGEHPPVLGAGLRPRRHFHRVPTGHRAGTQPYGQKAGVLGAPGPQQRCLPMDCVQQLAGGWCLDEPAPLLDGQRLADLDLHHPDGLGEGRDRLALIASVLQSFVEVSGQHQHGRQGNEDQGQCTFGERVQHGAHQQRGEQRDHRKLRSARRLGWFRRLEDDAGVGRVETRRTVEVDVDGRG